MKSKVILLITLFSSTIIFSSDQQPSTPEEGRIARKETHCTQLLEKLKRCTKKFDTARLQSVAKMEWEEMRFV